MNTFLSLLMVIMLVFPLCQVSATIIWSEDFEDRLDDWELQGYSYDGTVFMPNDSVAPSIVNGRLQMPNTQVYNNEFTVSYIFRNSTVANGTWSFDWHVTPGDDHSSYDEIFFMTNNFPNNLTGFSVDQLIGKYSGYRLDLKSADRGDSTFKDRSITLAKYLPNFFSILKYHQFNTSITGFHHIDVTRNLQGEFKVYYDSSLIIQYTDNTITTSEKCVIISVIGDSAFDNITASDDVLPPTTTTTTTANFPSLFILFSVGVLIILRRKKLR
jgi:hypothetical protein